MENGVTNGYESAVTFAPYGKCSRAEAVTFIWRAVGCPEPVTTEHPFTDVSGNAYYSKAVPVSYTHLAQACPDHIHMLISIPPKYSVAQIMGYLKGKSSLMIFDRHANLKYKYGNRHFWARGYYVDTVGRNKKQVAEYIRNQLASDQMADQIGMKEFVDPFTGRENKKA